jgi:predicted NBD/HSP70 family sugar kinase
VLAGGPVCGCGRRGCLEAMAGIDAVVARCLEGPDSPPRRYSGNELAAAVHTVAARAAQGDAEVRAALAEAGCWLGRGAATLINLMNPRVVILGGYFVPLATWLLPACRDAAGAHVLSGEGGWSVEVSTLGLTAAARGAAAAVIDALDRGALSPPSP